MRQLQSLLSFSFVYYVVLCTKKNKTWDVKDRQHQLITTSLTRYHQHARVAVYGLPFCIRTSYAGH